MKKKPIKSAATLSYKKEIDSAPKLVAKGKGIVAEKMIALAAAHNVPLYEDQDLVKVLEMARVYHESAKEVVEYI